MAKIKLLSESAIRKKYANANKASILLPDDKFIWLPSRSLALNWQLGGGLLYGRIHELMGYESTGKSLLAADFGAVAQSLGGVVLWGDAEGSFNPHWAIKNGLNPDKVEVYGGNDIEGYSDWHRDMIMMYRSRLTKNQPILLVCDSIAALERKDALNSTQTDDKAEMGNRAKVIYKMYRVRNSFYQQMGVCVLMINQVRAKLNVSMFESAETTPGGAATKYYSSIRLSLVGSKQLKGTKTKNGWKEDSNGEKVGRRIIFQVVKNKVAPPKNSVKSEVYFKPDKSGYVGFSRYHGLPEALELDGVVEKRSRSGYYFKDKRVGTSEDNFLEGLETRDKMRKFLLKKSSINTVSKTRARLEAIDENLFPLNGKEVDDDE